jgi:hypothetical protein
MDRNCEGGGVAAHPALKKRRIEEPEGGSPRLRSRVAGSLLDELHAGGQSEFGVDVGEMGLHRAR